MSKLTSKTLIDGQKAWLIEHKLSGMEDTLLLACLETAGIKPTQGRRILADIADDPCYRSAERVARRLRKLANIAKIRAQLRASAGQAPAIVARRDLKPEDFFAQYYVRNEPVVLPNLMRDWKAPAKWTFDYLKSTLGDAIVEVMAVAPSERASMKRIKRKPKLIKFSEYVDTVQSSGPTNDYYLVGYNRFLEHPAAQGLFDDFSHFTGFLDPAKRHGRTFFWFGPAGTVTPLHHDNMNIFMAQVRGRKRIKLIAPDQSHLVYNRVAVFSDVDCEAPDYSRYPLFKDAQVYDVVLEPGEVLFLPVGWWHHVRALDASITVTLTNFLFPNEFSWDKESQLPPHSN